MSTVCTDLFFFFCLGILLHNINKTQVLQAATSEAQAATSEAKAPSKKLGVSSTHASKSTTDLA